MKPITKIILFVVATLFVSANLIGNIYFNNGNEFIFLPIVFTGYGILITLLVLDKKLEQKNDNPQIMS